jgi:hypothetical protein
MDPSVKTIFLPFLSYSPVCVCVHFSYSVPAAIVQLSRSYVSEGLVESLSIVKNKVSADPLPRIPYGLVVVDIDVLILQRAPESLDEDIVEGPSPPVHADGNGFIDEQFGEVVARKLRSLVGVEDLRFPEHQCLLKGVDAEVDLQRE